MAKNKKILETVLPEFNEIQIIKLKTIAYLETWLQKLSQLLRTWISSTVNQVRKKQTSSYDELVADQKMRIQQGAGLINFQNGNLDDDQIEN